METTLPDAVARRAGLRAMRRFHRLWSGGAPAAVSASRVSGWALALLAAALCVVTLGHIPVRERIRLLAKAGSNFTAAPVLAVGDSIAYQTVPGSVCGDDVFNAAVPGDRVADLVADAADYAARLPARRVVIAVGINDAWPGHAGFQAWADAYERLVQLYAGRERVLVEINPVDPAASAMVARLDTDFIPRANDVIRRVGRDAGARVVPAPVAAPTMDGLHPTSEGREAWRARLSAAMCDPAPLQ